MKKLQCEVCGGIELKKVSEDVFECQHCGMQYSKEEVQRLLVDITGSVKVDHSDEVAKYLRNGKRFYESRDYDKAYETFCEALNIDPENSEALMYIGSTYSVKAVINGSTNSAMSDEALVYYIDALKTKLKQTGETSDFYEFAYTLLRQAYSHLNTAKEVMRNSRIEAIQNEQRINNIGADNVTMLFNKAGASKDIRNAVSAYDEYFSDIFFRLECAVKDLNLDLSKADDKFVIGYTKIMMCKYTGVNSYLQHRDWVSFDLQTVLSMGPERWENISEIRIFKARLENSGIDPVEETRRREDIKSTMLNFWGIIIMVMGLMFLGVALYLYFKRIVGDASDFITIFGILGILVLITGVAMLISGVRKREKKTSAVEGNHDHMDNEH